MSKKWRAVPKDLLSILAWNPNKPTKLNPERLHYHRCGSTVFQVVKEKRPYKHKSKQANRKRHTMVCVSCLKNAAFLKHRLEVKRHECDSRDHGAADCRFAVESDRRGGMIWQRPWPE